MERILEDVSYAAGDAEGEVGPGAECAPAQQLLPVSRSCPCLSRVPWSAGSEAKRELRRYVVTAELVEEKTKDLLANVDMSKFVL